MPYKNVRGYEIPKVSIKEAFKETKDVYESPISVYMEHILGDVTKKIHEQQENYVMEAVQNVHIDVDKEELLKALRYDRDQYEKGFEDGKKSVWVDVKERLPEKNGSYLVMISEFGLTSFPMVADFANNIRIWTLDEGENRPGFHIGDNEIKTVVAWMEIPPYRGMK